MPLISINFVFTPQCSNLTYGNSSQDLANSSVTSSIYNVSHHDNTDNSISHACLLIVVSLNVYLTAKRLVLH